MAPGIDIERLAQMDFEPIIINEPELMDARILLFVHALRGPVEPPRHAAHRNRPSERPPTMRGGVDLTTTRCILPLARRRLRQGRSAVLLVPEGNDPLRDLSIHRRILFGQHRMVIQEKRREPRKGYTSRAALSVLRLPLLSPCQHLHA